MALKTWHTYYADKCASATEALSHVRNGQTIFVGSGAGEPQALTRTLAELAPKIWNIEIIHLTAAREESRFTQPELVNTFRYNTFYIGRGVSAQSAEGTADFTPMNVRELPTAMANGVVHVDVALIQVSPPDDLGLCSLGISVDATKAAAEHADLVIAQVNKNMPVTLGDSLIPVDEIDFLVEEHEPLIEVALPQPDPISLTIGRYIAGLIGDGMTLHFTPGPISACTMRYLDTKKDLGIHTAVFTDDIMRLIQSRAVTNRNKDIHKGKTVATMAMGSEELYREIGKNPYIEFLPIEEVNDPFIISRNEQMVSVHSIQEIEITGMATADTRYVSHVRGLPASMDFIYGASRSKKGFNIMALPSTSADGTQSNIVAQSSGHGVFFSRAKVDYVVTEYGIANLYGRSIRERVISLIHIAHPKFRHQLLEEAKQLNYVGPEQIIPPDSGGVYPHQYEFTHTFKGDTQVFFRPVKPCDASRLQKMFYSLSPESVRMRYHGTIKSLSNETAQRMAAVDYSQDMAIVGLVGPRGNQRLIAEGRYLYNPENNMGEFDILVHEDYQRRGIGIFLADYLKKIAFSRGLAGVYAEVIDRNDATIALLDRAWPTAMRHFEYGTCIFSLKFPTADMEKPKDSIIVYSGRFGDFSYGQDHPFDPGRARNALQLIEQEGCLHEPWMRVEEPDIIAKEKLIQSHDPGYIAALEEANSGKMKESFVKYNLGGDECPVFAGLFDYVLLYTSATIKGVELITEENANVVFNPLGGFHHANRAYAEGFCYVNDVIVAIDLFLAKGFRVAYIDIDAHHGNGVQDAYYKDDRVLTVSVHESGKTLYPWGGFETEVGEDIGQGFNINIPLPMNTDDEAFIHAFDQVVTPAVNSFAPSVVIAVVGTDTHKSDPLSNLSLTNNGMMSAVKRIRDFAKHLLLLGGGGYDMQSVTKAWCRMWAAANRIDALPDYLLVMGGTFMGGGGLSGAEVVDMAYRVSGDEKNAILDELDRIVTYHEKHTLPLIKERVGNGK